MLAVDQRRRQVTLKRDIRHRRPLFAFATGSDQLLPNANRLVTWGITGWFTEYDPDGHVCLDAHLPGNGQNYRVFRFPWTATPPVPPAFKAYRQGAGAARFYASWNGSTGLASWRLETGRNLGALRPGGAHPKQGFETSFAIPPRTRYAAAVALDAGESCSGALGRFACTSRARRVRAGTGARPSGPSRRPARCTCERERALVGLVDEQATGLAAPVRTRLAEPRRGRDDSAARLADQTSNSCRSATAPWWMCPARISSAPASTSAAEHVVAPRDRPLARAPRRADQLVVQRDNAQGAARRGGELSRRAVELAVADAAGLVAPRPHRVEADDGRRRRRRAPGRSSPRARSNSAHGRVNRAGNVYGMS